MKALNYLPYSEFKRILDANLFPETQRRLLTSMASLNRLACAQKAGLQVTDCRDTSMELLIWMYEKARLNQEHSLSKTSFVVDLDTHNPAVRALRFASDQQSSLFEDSPARTRESEPNWLTPAPGSAIPHGIGLALGRALHGAAGRTIVLTDNNSRWQSQLCNPLVTIMQQELKSLCVVVRMEKHDE
ncbi:hypothetical protein EH220_08040, partial [bacterium]